MTTKDRLDELTQRIERIESKLWPGCHNVVKARRIYSPPPEAEMQKPPLQELTEEEAAWLKARNIPADTRQQLSVSVHQSRTSEDETRIIRQLQKKRNIYVTWHA